MLLRLFSSENQSRMMTEAGMQLGTLGALALSVVSAVAIVICNKVLITTLGFGYATTLSGWHLVITYASLQIAYWFNLFQKKMITSQVVMGFGVLNAISIAFLNLSLGYNSVGFYQMTKLAIIPCTVVLETIFLRKHFSRNVQLSLAVLLSGVGIATVTDLQLNFRGTVLSLCAILTTCIAQIMTNNIQKSYKVSSTQLLFQSCPYQVTTLLLAGPLFDWILTKENVFAYNYNFEVVTFIICSCLVAVFVNFSTFLVIGRTSPVSYQVLGHLKTCLVLAFGYVALRTPFSWRNIFGILVAVVGMGLYSYCSIKEGQQQQTNGNAQVPQVAHKEDSLIAVENGGTKQNISEDAAALAASLWNKTSAEKET